MVYLLTGLWLLLTSHGDLMVPDIEVNVIKVVEKDELPGFMALLHSLHPVKYFGGYRR